MWGKKIMALIKLANELEETIRQTRELATDMQEVLSALTNADLSPVDAQKLAIQKLVVGLQAQDRIEQRCTSIQSVIGEMISVDRTAGNGEYAEIWKSLTLDELSKPELSGVSGRMPHGEVDLF